MVPGRNVAEVNLVVKTGQTYRTSAIQLVLMIIDKVSKVSERSRENKYYPGSIFIDFFEYLISMYNALSLSIRSLEGELQSDGIV